MTLSRRDALRSFAVGGAGLALAGTGLACSSDETSSAGDASAPTTSSGSPGSPSTSAAGTPSAPVELTGRLVRPGDADYDDARQAWDRLFVSYPLVIVFAQETEDVVNALTWCRQNDVAFRVRSGRHNLQGWSSIDGGVVIDVSELSSIELDADAGTATVGTGATQGEVVAALAQTGHALPSGSEASVGIAGVTLGGGIGTLSRAMGVTCDNLVSVEMVVPDGADAARSLVADEQRDADLLWASRGGGGGNFGVATAFTFRVHELSEVTHFTVTYDWSDPAGVFDAWQAWAPSADDRLGSTFVFLPQSGGQIVLDGTFTGPRDEIDPLLEPVTSVGGPAVTVETLPYGDYYASINSSPRQTDFWLFASSWAYEPLPADAIGTIADFMTRAPAPACNYWCLSWGGAAGEAPPGGSAFFHRDALFYAEPGAGWNDPALDGACYSWVAEFDQALRPFVRGGYVNVPNAAAADWETAYYGDHAERLRQVKTAYDPTEVFRFEQSIPPG